MKHVELGNFTFFTIWFRGCLVYKQVIIDQ